MFVIGSEYTRSEIHQNLGGSVQSYMPTVAGHVVAVCVKPELNPRAPNVILCGIGPIISSVGETLARQRDAVPVFIKRAPNHWEYRGKFKVMSSHSAGPQFMALLAGSGRKPSDVSLAIQLA